VVNKSRSLLVIRLLLLCPSLLHQELEEVRLHLFLAVGVAVLSVVVVVPHLLLHLLALLLHLLALLLHLLALLLHLLAPLNLVVLQEVWMLI
jgi:hypothetical protein